MTAQASVLVSFVIYVVFFGWLGWQRGMRREIVVFLIALIAWLLLQQEGDTVVRIANLGGAALAFAQGGGFSGDSTDALATLGSATPLINEEGQQPFLFVIWVALFVGAYALSNVMVEDKKSPRNGWAILLGILNGFFFAVAFGPSLLTLFTEDGQTTLTSGQGIELLPLLRSGLELVGSGISSLWALISSAGNLGLVVMLTLLLVLAAGTIKGGAKPKS
jgi:hypothetical protein